MAVQGINYRTILSGAIAAGILGIMELPLAAATLTTIQRWPATASVSPNIENTENIESIDSTGFSSDGGILVAGLSFRLGVRPSRWRFGGLARSCAGQVDGLNFDQLQEALKPVAPPLLEADQQNAPVDQTLSAYPTVFVRVPRLPGATVQFTLQNEDATEELYATQFELTGEAGIVGIQVPDTASPLQVGEKYAWQILVTLPCEADGSSFRLHTGSWIERVSPEGSLATIDQVPLRDRPSIYADAGIWQETISTLAQLRYQNPGDAGLDESWASLMQSVNLEELAAEPIVQITK